MNETYLGLSYKTLIHLSDLELMRMKEATMHKSIWEKVAQKIHCWLRNLKSNIIVKKYLLKPIA